MGDVALEGGSRLTRDIALALIAGFLTGAPAIPIVINLGFATVLKIPPYLIPPIAAGARDCADGDEHSCHFSSVIFLNFRTCGCWAF